MSAHLIEVVNKSHLRYVDAITDTIKIEAGKKNMMYHNHESICNTLELGDGCISTKNGVFGGFVSLCYWNNYVEIAALVVSFEFRGNNLGDRLFREVKKLAIKKSKNRPILILANEISRKIAIKHGFQEVSKLKLDNNLWLPCRTECLEYKDFPNCHCCPLLFIS